MLARHDILLIADEVVTGFGRLGSMFGSDHYGIRPDIITIAKGLTSAYAPLSGSIVGDKVWKVLEKGADENGAIGHGWTYSAHPIGAAAGIANLKLVDSLGLVANAGDTGAYLTAAMRDALADHPHVGDVRGEGMLCAVEFVEDRDARRFFDPSPQDRPAGRRRAPRPRRHRPRHAAGRHPRLRPAALPDPGRGRHRRRRHRRRRRRRAAARR